MNYPDMSVLQSGDIYSYGVILYEMITGIHPWNGLSVKDIHQQILNGTLLTVDSDVISKKLEETEYWKGYIKLMNMCKEYDYSKRTASRNLLVEVMNSWTIN